MTRGIVGLIAIIQVALGVIFIASPGMFPSLLGLPAAPAWTDWMFAMLGARAIGFAYGMVLAARDLTRHRSWLVAMVVVQALDWLATIGSVWAGKVTLMQVSTAAFLPLVFICIVGAELWRRRPAAA